MIEQETPKLGFKVVPTNSLDNVESVSLRSVEKVNQLS